MVKLSELVGQQLRWTQPHTNKMEYELHAGDQVVATLRFRSAFGSLATAECAEGSWTFKRVGFLQTRVTIRAGGEETNLAIFHNNTWDGGGTLELPDGRKYLANTNFWATKYEFRTEDGEPLIRYSRIGGLLHLSAEVEILPAAQALVAEFPWVVPLGWYLAVMMHADSVSVSASSGVVG